MRTLLAVVLWLLPLLHLQPVGCGGGWSHARPRLQISHSELLRGQSLLWKGAASGMLLLDEDQSWLLAGGRDHIHLLRPDSLQQPISKVHWPAAAEQVERCLLAGKNLESECANFVRLLQPFNKTHIYACGTGAFYPQCTFLHLDLSTKEPSMSLSDDVESGRGKCPFSPSEPFTAVLTGGELFAGTSVDFMGANAAVFRTTLGRGGGSSSSSQHYIRTEAYDHNWLNEPEFVASFSIPDSLSSDDDKVYFFFREWAVAEEGAGPWNRKLYARVARVCKKDSGGRRSLIHRWTTFLKAQLVCSLPGPGGLDTHFNHLEDVFLLETKDPLNPTFYGLFTTSSSVFRGSAVCVFSMSSLRAAFNGPFAHRDSPHHHWVEFKGQVPYPRPGACPSETYDPLLTSTRDLPDQVVSFMRQHQLMWEPVLPLGGRPMLTLLAVEEDGNGGHALLTRLVVNRVEAEDGPFDVFHLGTEDGKVLKAVAATHEWWQTDEILLEELSIFPKAFPILSMKLSTKRQQLFVSSKVGVAQVALQHCELYGSDCARCGLARDPYCSWDGQTCSRFFASNKRRARRQDVRNGDDWSQCPVTQDDMDSAPVRRAYGVEGNATFLECEPDWPQANIQWIVQGDDGVHTTLPQSDDSHALYMRRGLLVQRLQQAYAGLYTCTGHEHSYRKVLARYRLHVLPSHSLLRPVKAPPPRRYKDPNAVAVDVTSELPGLGQDCEQWYLWYQREKRRQQKLQLKLKLSKQESKKARVRRNYPAL